MKNIRVYKAPKYGTDLYEEVESNIYKTYDTSAGDNDSFLALEVIDDEEKAEIIRNLDTWKPGIEKYEEDLYVVVYEGRKYYKEIDDEDEWIMVNSNDNQAPTLSYVSSIIFEAEPEYGENNPTDYNISQYPLEDILDKFDCECFDFYEEENKSDPINSYIEFSSEDIDNIRKLLSIIGKHVYNKEDNDYVKLIIE